MKIPYFFYYMSNFLRMWAKISHMQAAFISLYTKCFWFMSLQCLFPAWNKLWTWTPKKWKRESECERETETEWKRHRQLMSAQGEKEPGKSSDRSRTGLPSLECVSPFQVFIRRYDILSCSTALLFIFPVFSWEINEGSGYSLNIYKNKP